VPYGAGSGGTWRSLTVTQVTLTCTAPLLVKDHTNGKDGVAGSIPAGGSTQRLTSGNAGQIRVWGPVERAMLVVLAFGMAWMGACRMESTSLVNRSGSGRALP
jgi:hypothetical protein